MLAIYVKQLRMMPTRLRDESDKVVDFGCGKGDRVGEVGRFHPV